MKDPEIINIFVNGKVIEYLCSYYTATEKINQIKQIVEKTITSLYQAIDGSYKVYIY